MEQNRTDGFTIRPLAEADLDTVAALSGACVGENLYSKERLAAILKRPGHRFLLLISPSGELAGYIYFYTTDLEEMARFARLPVETLRTVAAGPHPVVGNIQSLAVSPAFRSRGLSLRLMQTCMDELVRLSAVTVFGVAWKIGEHIPAGPSALGMGMRYLTDAHGVWADDEALYCPVCKGRCHCDAVVYYKTLQGDDAT